MKLEKIIVNVVIAFCVLGLLFSIGQQHFMNRIFSITMFVVPIAALFWARKNAPGKTFAILIIVFALQLFSFNFGQLSYSYSLGFGFISYFSLDNFRHTTDLLQLSTFRVFSSLPTKGFSIGINIVAISMIAFLLYLSKIKFKVAR